MLTSSRRTGGRYLTVYEYSDDGEPRRVRPSCFERLLTRTQDDVPQEELIVLLPCNHFVWVEELDQALAAFVHDNPECADPEVQTEGPSTCDINASKQRLRKANTKARHLRWHQAYKEISDKNPGKSDQWIAIQISKLAIAEGRRVETIRKNMKPGRMPSLSSVFDVDAFLRRFDKLRASCNRFFA